MEGNRNFFCYFSVFLTNALKLRMKETGKDDGNKKMDLTRFWMIEEEKFKRESKYPSIYTYR